MVSRNKNCGINYLLPGLNREADRMVGANITKIMHNKFSDIFSGIGYFEGTYVFQLRQRSKPYQVLLRC